MAGNTYKSVPDYASEHGVDLTELKKTTQIILNEQGKVPAIKHVNSTFNLGYPLPLPSTKKYVDELQ